MGLACLLDHWMSLDEGSPDEAYVCGGLCVMNNPTGKSKLKLLDKKHFSMIIGCQN